MPRRIVDLTDRRVRHEATVEALERGASGLAFGLRMWVIVASRSSLRWASFAGDSASSAIIAPRMLGLLAHPTWAILRPRRTGAR